MSESRLHPIIRPAEEYEHPVYPVRDDKQLGPTEDLDREPDAFPHALFGVVMLLAWAVAIVIVIGWTENALGDVIVALVGVPLVIYGLTRLAARKRERLHPAP